MVWSGITSLESTSSINVKNQKKKIPKISHKIKSHTNHAIIKKWQAKYPNNITYIYKENGGQASARNLGLKQVDTEWVTFTDPDDFLDLNYFAEVDKAICEDVKIAIIATHLIFYFEENRTFKDTHPLVYRFAKNKDMIKIECSKLEKNINEFLEF